MKNTGGMAFPGFEYVPGSGNTKTVPLPDGRIESEVHQHGMTLRDYFASQALAGMLGGAPGSHLAPVNAVREAYAFADAMLAEREKA